jgi:hypothetical protein
MEAVRVERLDHLGLIEDRVAGGDYSRPAP